MEEMKSVLTIVTTLLVLDSALNANGQILVGSSGSCIAGGVSSCCSDWCQVGDCYCDVACFDFLDCCTDVYQLQSCGSFTGSQCTPGNSRIQGGSNQGYVDVCIFGVWSPVCRDSSWDFNAANVVCGNLGYGSTPSDAASFIPSGGSSTSSVQHYTASCGGGEGTLTQCLIQNTACSQQAGIRCAYVCSSGCQNGGSCVGNNLCACTSQWTGSSCQTPICDPSCFQGSCVAPDTCSCNPGWTGSTCNNDINECGTANGGCEHDCSNTVGSFTCSCFAGYALDGNGLNCNDINECASSNGGCEQTCGNLPGTFICTCGDGYSLAANGFNCDDVDECTLGTSGCEQLCTNTIGSYKCDCNVGYFLLDDKHSCTDHNECINPAHHQCDQTCHNVPGSYFCSCNAGYMLQDDDYTCLDIDECTDGLHGCNHNCHNTVPGFYCSCDPGFHLADDSMICVDTNECLSDNGGCGHNCVNEVGTYHCTCKAGYTLQADGFTCVADPCPSIFAPLNGNMQCTGEQVTDESCTFNCELGYSLTGSAMRTCQADHMWTGETAECPPLECGALTNPENGVIIAPCYDEFMDQCTVMCEQGYLLNGSTIQACNLTSNNVNEVKWTEGPICKEILPCDPNPCLHGGQCSVSEEATPLCNCTGTLYKGDSCEMGLVLVPEIPILTQGTQSQNFTIQAAPTSDLNIGCNVNYQMQMAPSTKLVVKGQEKSTNFSLTPQKTGLFPIGYFLYGQAVEEANFETPENSVILVKSSSAGGTSSSFFSSLGLPEGEVGVGCCKYNYTFPIPSSSCANTITLSSSCNWDESYGDLITSGTVFVTSEGLDLPISLVGLGLSGGQGYFSTYLPSVFSGGTRDCSQCVQCQPTTTSSQCLSTIADSSATGCKPWSQSISFNEGDMVSMLTTNAMSVTFFKKIQTLLPSWLTVQGNSAAVSNGYNLFDYKSFVGSSSDAIKLLGCENLPSSTSGLAYSFRTTSEMQINIWEGANVYKPSSTDSSPLCLSLDLCLGENSPLFFSIPEGLHALILSQPQFLTLIGIGWKFSFYYVQFHKYGVTVDSFTGPFLIASVYSEDVQSPWYDFMLQGRVSGTLLGGSTVMNVEFVGGLYYKAAISGNEIPGLVKADTLELSVSTYIGEKKVTLYLSSNQQPFAFDFPGSTLSSTSPITSAISSQMTYKYSTYSDGAFFSELLMLPGFASQCPFDIYMQLNSNFEVEWLTFASSCVGLRLGKLEFISDFVHYGEFKGLSTHSDLTQDFAILTRSFLDPPDLQLGSFFQIFKNPSNPCLTLYYTSSSSDVSGTLFNVNITVFDSEINSDIVIDGSSLSFKGSTTIFKHYPVMLTGWTSTVDPWSDIAMDVQGSLMQEGYIQPLNTYLADFILKKANETTTKRANAKANRDNSQQLLQSLQIQFAEAEAQVNALADEYQAALNEITFWNQETSNAESNYNQALQDYGASQDVVEELQSSCPTGACDQVCVPGINCTTCYEQTVLMESGTCPTYKTVTEKQVTYQYFKTTGWRYELRTYTCWGMVRVGLYCTAFSKVCTKVVCASYVIWSSKPVEIDVVKVVKEDKPCIVQAYDETAPGECCQEYPCASTIPDPQCVATKAQCQEALKDAQSTLSSDAADLTELYQIYQDAKSSLTAAEVTAASKKIELDSAQQQLMILSPALESSQVAFETSQGYYNQVLEETSWFQLLVDVLNAAKDASSIMSITDMSFDERIHTDTPIAFPITISYVSADSSYQTSAVVNFESPKELVLRGFSESVVDHFLTVANGNLNGRRRKRQLITVETNNLYQQFQQRCTDLHNIKTYFTQIASTTNSSMQSLEETLLLIYNVSNATNSLINGSTSVPELEDVYSAFASNASNASSSLASIAGANAFPRWQTTMQLLHNGSVTVGGYPCVGFSDCLQVAVDVVQVLLEDTPGDEAQALLIELLGNKDGLLELGYVKDLSLQEALPRLEYIGDIIETTNNLGYWCSEPPAIVENPPLEMNVSIGASFTLTCRANSSLPITYQWKKDGLLLNAPKQEVLTFLNMQMGEAGNYSCVASNAVGSTSSLSARINVFYAPIFNGTITDTKTIEGNDNGVNLACDAHSWPPPGWRWLYRSSSSDNWTEVEGIDVNVLPLDNPHLEDEGWYMCVAENWMGNATSDPIYLTVLPVAIVRIKYPLTFEVDYIEQVSQNQQADDGSTMQFDPQPIVSALRTTLGLNLTQIEKVEVAPTDDTDNRFSISLDLIMPQLVPLDLPSMTFEDLLQFATPAMMEVMEAATLLPQVLTEPGIAVTTDEGQYQTVNGSLVFGIRAFTCPQGHMLHDSLILCVACSPGQYQGPPKVMLTDLGGGEFIHEEMDQCFSCPVGSYQDKKAATSCVTCPKGHSTHFMGSESAQDCSSYCKPGSISQAGLERCMPCPPRYYQLEYGATGCLPCTDDVDDIQCYIPTEPTQSPETTFPTEGSVNIAVIAGGAAAAVALFLLIIIGVIIIVCVTYHHHAKYGISGKKLEDIDPDYDEEDTSPIISSIPFESDTATKLDIKGGKKKKPKSQKASKQAMPMGGIPQESDRVKKLKIVGGKKQKRESTLAVTTNAMYGELEPPEIESVTERSKENPLFSAMNEAEIKDMIGEEIN